MVSAYFAGNMPVGQFARRFNMFIFSYESCIQQFQQFQNLIVFRYIGHRMAVMDKVGSASLVHNHLGRHATQFEQIDFLPVEFQHTGLGVWQANKRQIMRAPIGFEGFGIFRANHNNPGLPFNKFLKILAQLRYMPLAKGSGKTAIEYRRIFDLPIKLDRRTFSPRKLSKAKSGAGVFIAILGIRFSYALAISGF